MTENRGDQVIYVHWHIQKETAEMRMLFKRSHFTWYVVLYVTALFILVWSFQYGPTFIDVNNSDELTGLNAGFEN